jgi:hypothetical protein
MKTFLRFGALMCAFLFASTISIFAQGMLTPPGTPAPTMKTLDQVNPGTPISTAPYIINAPGFYYLTTNLTGVANQYGIVILADNVTLDLNGFAMLGVNNSFAGIGIFGQKNVCVRNGIIRNWAQGGVTGLTNCRLEKLFITDNGPPGAVSVTDNSSVIDCTASQNNGGIGVGNGSSIRGCISSGITGYGFVVGDGCTLIGCTATANTAAGFSVGKQVTLKDCTAKGNASVGIKTGRDGTVAGSTASANQSHGIMVDVATNVLGCTADDNMGTGIVASTSSTIKDCTATVNKGAGISAGLWGTVANCTAADNGTDGILVDSYSLVVGNNCVQHFQTGLSAGIHATAGSNRIEGNNVAANGHGISADSGANVIIKNSALFNFNGNYTALAAGATVAGGGSVTAMKNQNGVVMEVTATQTGVKLTLAGEGIEVKLKN